ncbi:unnamed protein product [Ambrosiozyma monospora]|uniref:Unnamed protein product n=1 Tax=Ambrosiozyma monospora TaxID=43982 RepID=A0A9W6YSQ1_AMBMO|nr:unnamed protein product [Ambrosiozyma monospora]
MVHHPGLRGWEYIFADEENEHREKTPRRSRGRRTANSDAIILRREEDSLELKAGDCVLLDDPKNGGDCIAFIRDIAFGTESFLEVKSLLMFKIHDIDLEYLPVNEDNKLVATKKKRKADKGNLPKEMISKKLSLMILIQIAILCVQELAMKMLIISRMKWTGIRFVEKCLRIPPNS